ncbi:MAG: exopolyphosphatase [Henriciella sp.]|jgi:exopolyphosphatase/guanosine-5'-triphosphate,3'-diphosphate pyrophosphatase|uniref:Ppx/GppA phosphatase family protein n=1 Tax=Henriciella sp. TaxID=1968823 RepID=UPI000C0CF47D|nr:Ppx/GppA phosphatase family protein [Henriciella sp.]MAN73142.1 exopolyphosphatase [Henriciella sp.]MBF35415.1 exopolyphosphatase [Hyphomonadaceae bacterium]MBK75481.1 exopolyphosphatase [Henriciella sp.]PHR79291.1 MAG: exopolyphosphatase [Henriciella sp.]|tara:strand:+ start:43039 stop:44538 length:1500 start_codon:yes stop_codon:yes gene_type:complete
MRLALQPEKAAVVDIGSNSVRLVIYEVTGAAALPYFNEKVLAGLGRGLPETGKLSPEGVVDAMAAIRRYRAILTGLGVTQVTAVATAAVRDAEDGPDFARMAATELGARLRILSGAEEGRLSALGVRMGFDQPDGIVSDLGGSSLEFQRITPAGQDGQGETHRLGPFSMSHMEGAKPAERRKAIRKVLKSSELLNAKTRRLYAVGGSWRALASVHMDIKAYPLAILHGYRLNGQAVRTVVRTILATQRDKELASHISGIVGRRFDTIVHAALVLDEVFDAGGFKEVLVSANGLREGVLFDQGEKMLFETMREPYGDALIDGTIAFLRLEKSQLDFGEALYDFIRPVLPRTHSRQRLFRAACLMADCGGRFHPDHRADMAYYLILRSPIRGISHDERVLLAHATGARYTHKFQRPKAFTRLGLDSDDQLARIMGAAMRLGAVYSGRSAPLLKQARLKPSKSKLVLEVQPGCADMVSGTVKKRFEQLATFLDLDAQISTAD